jgi:hypothetical protein
MFDPTGNGSDMSGLGGGMPDPTARPARPPRQGGGYHGHQGGGDRGGRYANDLHSITIHARQRTFYIDLKESGNGRFFKISEKSRGGQKTTIMFDSEDLPKFIEALNEMQTKLPPAPPAAAM